MSDMSPEISPIDQGTGPLPYLPVTETTLSAEFTEFDAFLLESITSAFGVSTAVLGRVLDVNHLDLTAQKRAYWAMIQRGGK